MNRTLSSWSFFRRSGLPSFALDAPGVRLRSAGLLFAAILASFSASGESAAADSPVTGATPLLNSLEQTGGSMTTAVFESPAPVAAEAAAFEVGPGDQTAPRPPPPPQAMRNASPTSTREKRDEMAGAVGADWGRQGGGRAVVRVPTKRFPDDGQSLASLDALSTLTFCPWLPTGSTVGRSAWAVGLGVARFVSGGAMTPTLRGRLGQCSYQHASTSVASSFDRR